MPKIIGVGFHKTGTTTLGKCLKILGYNYIPFNRKAFLLYQSGKIDAVLTLMEYFDGFEDWPWPFVYREAYARFPNAKFVLTTRVNENVWFESLVHHAARETGANFHGRKFIYGYEEPTANRAHHIEIYTKHNEEVREFFSDKEGSLLEVCWERGDGWKELCCFLGVPVPDAVFPHCNKGPQVKPLTLQGMMARLASAAAKRVRRTLRR